MFLVCVTVGLVLLASKYRDNVLRSVKNICHSVTNNYSKNNQSVKNDEENNKRVNNKTDLFKLDKIILADSIEKCNYAVQRIRCDLSEGVLGFDCEWVNGGPVSLLQLATYNGVCVLFRLGKIGFVPPKLKELLSNNCILKVGVAPFEDASKLTNDYGCRVFGTLDLRTFADTMGIPSRRGLAALCMQYLGVELDKIIELRCSDWDADELSDDQIAYAANDAYASVMIYRQMLQRVKKRSMWEELIIFIKTNYIKKNQFNYFIHTVPRAIIDVRYREQSSKILQNNIRDNNNTYMNNLNMKKESGNSEKVSFNQKISSIPTRKEPLYHNCYLEAPDAEILCTCDRKKAEWYVSKGLGVLVKEEPFTVRLTFEPSGRAHGKVGQYYTQVKLNQCVVCGSQDKFIKKNVVPREYRKYFPLVMKAHQSHDVLLLCPSCHEISNKYDLELRRDLAEMCDAPLTRSSTSARSEHHQQRRKFLSAVKALKDSPTIPQHRREELESRVREYSGQEFIETQDYLKDNIESDSTSSSSMQGRCPPHGLAVVEYFKNTEGGLVTLEKEWREHFLRRMQPKHLPSLWSVSHNQERLEIRQVQNRIMPEDAQVAGIRR